MYRCIDVCRTFYLFEFCWCLDLVSARADFGWERHWRQTSFKTTCCSHNTTMLCWTSCRTGRVFSLRPIGCIVRFSAVAVLHCCLLSAHAATSSSAFAFFAFVRSSAACCQTTFAASACFFLYSLAAAFSSLVEFLGVVCACLHLVLWPHMHGPCRASLETRKQRHRDTLYAVEDP
jgi:hypothetical protein